MGAPQTGEVTKPRLQELDIVHDKKCLNRSCSRTELVYQEPDREWFSDLESGQYCLEDFFIPDIDAAEITKIAKLFDFKEFSIEWCQRKDAKDQKDPKDPKDRKHPQNLLKSLQILKPSPNEIFSIRSDTPLELQETILKANQDVEWTLNSVRVGYGEKIFIQPVVGKHSLQAVRGDQRELVEFEVKEE